MQQGNLVEQGTFEQLLKKNGVFARIYNAISTSFFCRVSFNFTSFTILSRLLSSSILSNKIFSLIVPSNKYISWFITENTLFSSCHFHFSLSKVMNPVFDIIDSLNQMQSVKGIEEELLFYLNRKTDTNMVEENWL